MGLFNPTTGKRVSGQGGQLTIAGVGTFGVTSCKKKRSYTNVDVTVTTSNCWDENAPITRGLTYDVEVPFDKNLPFIDTVFDAMYNANPGNPVVCNYVESNAAKTYSAACILESYEEDASNKDVTRVTFTMKVTGPVSIS